MDVVITSNSPGEVSSWVRVTVPALKRLRPDLRIIVALVPCPFASGAETRVARALPGVDLALSPAQTTAFFFGLQKPYQPAPRGLVVYLGGELWHALLLAWRLRYPSLAYQIRPTGWDRFFDFRAPQTEIGDLMVDGLRPGPRPAHPLTLGLYPGSRERHLRFSLGPFLRVAEDLDGGGLRFQLALSPFVDRQTLQRCLDRPLPLGLESTGARMEGDALVTTRGTRVGLAQEPVDLALCIPGTNTAELACLGVPFVCAFHVGVFIGWGGLGGLLERLPLGQPFKRWMRARRVRRSRFLALPNQRAGREVTPEVLVRRSMHEARDVLRRLLDDPTERSRRGRDLQAVMGPPGAAERLAERVSAALG